MAHVRKPRWQRLVSRWATITYRQGRRIVILIVGVTVVLIGVAMLVLPGPGVLVMVVGLAFLGIEFAWARRWLKKLKSTAADGVQYVKDHLGPGQRSDQKKG